MKWHDATKEKPELIQWPKLIEDNGGHISSGRILISFIDESDERRDRDYKIGYWDGKSWLDENHKALSECLEVVTHWTRLDDIPRPE